MRAIVEQLAHRLSKTLLSSIAALIGLVVAPNAWSAQGEMGTGIPKFSMYGDVMGGYVKIVSLSNATVGFPVGCSALYLTAVTLGSDHYKAAIASIIAARTAGMKIRFYAHSPRDGGCGVDYLEILD